MMNLPKASFDGTAQWIWADAGPWSTQLPNAANPYRVAYFRRAFDAPEGARLTVHVSADSRYILWCNGKRVGRGPAKGDVRHQFYETYILDDLLQPGRNLLAAQVVSYASAMPFPSESGAPGFIMSAAWLFVLEGSVTNVGGAVVERLDTDSRWKAVLDQAYEHAHRDGWGTFLGMFEDVTGARYPWGWQSASFDDSAWQPAKEVFRAFSDEDSTGFDPHVPHVLTPRIIPMLEETPCRFDGAARATGVDAEAWQRLLADDAPLKVPANTTAEATLFCDVLTTGFPVLETEGGAGAKVKLTYSEALFFDGKKSPDHRPEEGDVEGYFDRFYPGGGSESYEPFWWRTFRYVRASITTTSEPLTVRSMTYRFTAYPFTPKAQYASSDARHGRMWDMSWRTARLCAHETYEDCPYYEQLQYVGDTQVQALISYYVTGDSRLARQAIRHFDWSRDIEGITKSRYPSRTPQQIPPFSLLWVLMVRDYWWHTGDLAEVGERMDGIRANLRWFERHENADGLLEALPYWKVVDWVAEWVPSGYPPGADGGVSALINFQYACALKAAADMLDALGDATTSAAWRAKAERIVATLDASCWIAEEGLFRDRPDGDELSELTNAWAIQAGVPEERWAPVCEKLGRDRRLAAATLYGRFHVLRALRRAGAYERAVEFLDHWHTMMEHDLTTWPEEPYLGRSYCHAWSAAPLYEFLSGVLGVLPGEPGFARIIVKPTLWGMDHAEGEVPTPQGPVTVHWRVEADSIAVDVTSPEGVPLEIHLPCGQVHESFGGPTTATGGLPGTGDR